MAAYLYKNPETGETIEIIQTMNEKHIYVDKDGLEWKRVWTVPNASVDSISNLNPFDLKSYVEKTGKSKGTVGDLWSISKEASERRAEKLGHEDPVKRKFFDNYEKEKKVKHFADRPSKIETKNAVIDFTAPSPKIDL